MADVRPEPVPYSAKKSFKVFFVEMIRNLKDIGSADIAPGPLNPQFDKIRKDWTDEDYARQREPIERLFISPDLGLPVSGAVKLDKPMIVGHFEDQLSKLPIDYLIYDGPA